MIARHALYQFQHRAFQWLFAILLLVSGVVRGEETKPDSLPLLPDLPKEGAPEGAGEGPSTEEIIRNTALDAFMKEMVREALNKHVKDITVEGTAYAVGDVLFAIISAHEASQDWEEAETDSQRFYAGSRFVVAVLTPFTGGSSALVGLAITGNELFYRWGVAEHHEQAAAYAREAAESLARSEKIFTGLVRAEYEELRFLVNTRARLKESLVQLGQSFQTDCQVELKTIQSLDTCLVIMESQAIGIRKLIDLDRELIRFNGHFISMPKVFAKHGVDWEAAVEKMQQSLESTVKELEGFQSLIHQIVVRKWSLLEIGLREQASKLTTEELCESYAFQTSRVFMQIFSDQATAQEQGAKVDIQILDHRMSQLLSEAGPRLRKCGTEAVPLPREFRRRLNQSNSH